MLALQQLHSPITYGPGKTVTTPHSAFYENVESLDAFFHDLDQFVETAVPVGKLLTTVDDERLARYCIILSLFEMYFRSGQLHDLFVTPTICLNVDELLLRIGASWAQDVCQIGQRFYERQTSWLEASFILNPTFTGSGDVGGADADMVVDGCLIDIKTTKNPKVESNWLYQIVGYLLLDYDDSLAMRSAGIYMARQGELLRWPADELLVALTNDSTATLVALRKEFRSICEGIRKRNR